MTVPSVNDTVVLKAPTRGSDHVTKEHGTLDERYGLKPKQEATAPSAYDIPVTPTAKT